MLWLEEISIWNWSFEYYPYKNNYPWISYIRALNHFLINYIHLKLWFRMYLKEMFLLSYRSSEVIRKKLQKLFSDKLTFCNLKVVFTPPVRVKNFFSFKDKLPKMLLSGLIYKYKCGDCSANYYGKTKDHFKVRIWEHLGISYLTGKKIRIDSNKLTLIQDHLLCCNCSPCFADFYFDQGK